MSTEALTGQQVAEAGLDGWAFLLHYGLHGLQTRIHTEDFAAGLRIVQAIGKAAEELGHHADLDLRATRVDVRLVSGYDAGGVTEVDVRLARQISEIAAAAGAELECASLSRIELALDTPVHERIAPFWAAVLDRQYVNVDGWGDVGDRGQVHPLIWFQPSGSEEPRQRWHLDVWIDPDQIQPRIDAALAAGGTLIGRGTAPEIGAQLSDPDGNRVCLCSWRGRA
ncbi:VOC family protein [Flindersiella endophytica]